MIDHIKSAFASIWGNKLRSLLTVLGVIIGVSSVTILVSLGQGLKNDVANVIEGFGTNVLFVTGGKIDTSSKGGQAANPADFISGDVLTQADVGSIRALNGVTLVSPVSLVGGNLKNGTKTSSSSVLGATPDVLDTLQILTLGGGKMFTSNDGQEIVLSSVAKQDLFGDANPIGQNIQVGTQGFTVIGYLSKSKNSNAISSEYDSLSFIPFNAAKILNKGQDKIYRIFIHTSTESDVKAVKQEVFEQLKKNHGQEDFTVLTQDDILSLFDQFLGLATAMVSAIASISLLVGGIGIMNIMLVTVSERTREIGLRKAVGATQGAILGQFLTEAIIITLVGGLLGLAFSYAVAAIVRYNTPLHPSFSWEVITIALGISLVIGTVFGIWPALRAARKDPIEALRYE